MTMRREGASAPLRSADAIFADLRGSTPFPWERAAQGTHPSSFASSQLRELWTHDPLSIHAEYLAPQDSPGGLSVLMRVQDHVYAPLVCNRLFLLAELDILLLRPELPGGIVTSGGDIDNRLKRCSMHLEYRPNRRTLPLTSCRPASSHRSTPCWRMTNSSPAST